MSFALIYNRQKLATASFLDEIRIRIQGGGIGGGYRHCTGSVQLLAPFFLYYNSITICYQFYDIFYSPFFRSSKVI